LRILCVGDVVGNPGRHVAQRVLPDYLVREQVDFVIANGENAAGGSGLTPKVAEKLFAVGIDVLTNGDHCFRRHEILDLLARDPRVFRPGNFPRETPGRGAAIVESRGGVPVGIVNVLGRVFLPPIDDPFREADRSVSSLAAKAKVIVVDFHAEATSEKVAMGWFLDGRVSAVVGTHTHVQTADERVLPKGTGYITDLGMTGPYDSVIGRDKEKVIRRFWTHIPVKYEVAEGDPRLCGALLEVDPATGRCSTISRVRLPADGMRPS